MLFELSGVACVLNVKPIKEGFTKIQVIGSKSIKREGQPAKDISGARWINLNGSQADWWANNVESVKGAIVFITAQADTTNDGANYFENYRVNNFDDLRIIAWADKAKGINTALMTLSGTARVLNVHPMGQGFTKIQVINSETYKENETVCTRWINLNGGQADWWANNIAKVVGSTIEVRAAALTSMKQDGEEKRYFDNYSVNKLEIIKWAQPKTENNQQQQPQEAPQQAYSAPQQQTGFAPADGGYGSQRQ